MLPKLNRILLAVVALCALTLALSGNDPAASAASLDRKGMAEAKKATQLYKQGKYDDAAAIFLQLSLDNPGMPVFVRNLGACYYYLRRPEPALSNLREYLHKQKDIEPDDRAEVEVWIAEMDQLRRNGSSAAALPAGPTAPVTGRPVVQPGLSPAPESATARTDLPGTAPQGSATPVFAPAAPGPADTVARVPAPAESGQGSGRKVAAWALVGVGAAALVTGGVLSYLASTDFSDVEKKYDPGKESEGRNYAKAQWIGYSVGGAAVAAGVILLLTDKSTKSVAVAPAAGPGLAGATLSGTF